MREPHLITVIHWPVAMLRFHGIDWIKWKACFNQWKLFVMTILLLLHIERTNRYVCAGWEFNYGLFGWAMKVYIYFIIVTRLGLDVYYTAMIVIMWINKATHEINLSLSDALCKLKMSTMKPKNAATAWRQFMRW